MLPPRGPQSKNSSWFIFTFITGVGRSESASKPRHERAMLSVCFQQATPIVANVGGRQTCHKWARHSVWTIKKQICKTQKRIKTCQDNAITGQHSVALTTVQKYQFNSWRFITQDSIANRTMYVIYFVKIKHRLPQPVTLQVRYIPKSCHTLWCWLM